MNLPTLAVLALVLLPVMGRGEADRSDCKAVTLHLPEAKRVSAYQGARRAGLVKDGKVGARERR